MSALLNQSLGWSVGLSIEISNLVSVCPAYLIQSQFSIQQCISAGQDAYPDDKNNSAEDGDNNNNDDLNLAFFSHKNISRYG